MDFHAKIRKFIENFKQFEQNNVLFDTFTGGYCYWFAVILAERFSGGQILYEPVEGHFVTKIANRYYDIRGDVTKLYQGKQFYDEAQCLDTESILNGCVLKIN